MRHKLAAWGLALTGAAHVQWGYTYTGLDGFGFQAFLMFCSAAAVIVAVSGLRKGPSSGAWRAGLWSWAVLGIAFFFSFWPPELSMGMAAGVGLAVGLTMAAVGAGRPGGGWTVLGLLVAGAFSILWIPQDLQNDDTSFMLGNVLWPVGAFLLAQGLRTPPPDAASAATDA